MGLLGLSSVCGLWAARSTLSKGGWPDVTSQYRSSGHTRGSRAVCSDWRVSGEPWIDAIKILLVQMTIHPVNGGWRMITENLLQLDKKPVMITEPIYCCTEIEVASQVQNVLGMFFTASSFWYPRFGRIYDLWICMRSNNQGYAKMLYFRMTHAGPHIHCFCLV